MSSIKTDTKKKPLLQKITIMAAGSRGDIQPFVAIGIALKKAGYAVRIFTQPSETHEMLLNDFGLEYVPFGIDVDRSMREDKETRKSMETGDTMKLFKRIASSIDNHTAEICEPFYDEFIVGGEVHRPDLLLVSYLSRYFGLYAKYVLKIPTIEIKLQHWVFDNPKRAPMGLPTLPLGMHKFIQTKLLIPQDYKNFQKFDKCISNIEIMRKTAENKINNSSSGNYNGFSIPCLDDFLLYNQLLESEVNHSPLLPTLVCQSPIFKDILHPTLPSSKMLRFIGPAVIEMTDQIREGTQSFGSNCEREKIKEFIASNLERKPVYMGWGSMIRKSIQEMVIFAVEALMMSNQRGIVLGGLAGLSMEVLEAAVVAGNATNDGHGKKIIDYAKENVIFVNKAPHAWLFPQVSMTVHHGGAGTLNAALRSGVPTIVTPVFVDQYDNSFAVQNLGVGIGFKQQLQKIDSEDLSKAISAVANNLIIAKRAKEVGDKIRNENGCSAIVKEVEKYWIEDVTTGRLLVDIEDWKSATKQMKSSNDRKTQHNRILIGSALIVAGIAFFAK
mmetsp:Transcript_16576/g.18419  ORF Transcript_16576/g.18419 Transcript_16576/m.18419 type:complete len:557 (+) Transcript_16576:63-1733(+)